MASRWRRPNAGVSVRQGTDLECAKRVARLPGDCSQVGWLPPSLVGRFGCPTRLAYRVDCLLDPIGASITLLDAAGHNTTSSQRGGCRRARRARAGFEIDHSEPQARVWRSRGRPGPKAPDTQAPHQNLEPRPTSTRRPGPEAPDTRAVLADTSMSREKRGPVRTGNRVPSGGPRPGWRSPRLCPGRPGVPQPARSRGGHR